MEEYFHVRVTIHFHVSRLSGEGTSWTMRLCIVLAYAEAVSMKRESLTRHEKARSIRMTGGHKDVMIILTDLPCEVCRESRDDR